MALDPLQIDPVTGLPISGDLGIIQQIPLGKQMFDWESYDATARMVRPPLYGDDVLPTVTNVQGQHPGTGSAQSIESDGNHRLKVAVDSNRKLSSANGVLTNAGQWISYGYELVDTQNITWSTILGGMLSVSWTANAGALLSNGAMYLYVSGSDTSMKVPIGSLMLPDAVLAGATPVFGLSVPLCSGGPLDFSNVFPGQLDQINVFVRIFSNPVLWSYTFYTDGA